MQKTILMIVAVTLVGAGCSHTVRYNSNHVPSEEIFATLDGKGLVVTDTLQDERHEKSSPSSITGAAMIIEFAIGDVSREVTKTVFGRRFKQGIFHANEFDASNNYTAIIEPEITSLNWRMNALKNLGFETTPEANVTLKITLKDSTGNVLSNKTYSSGWVSGGSYVFTSSPQEKANIAVHRAVFTAAVKAADDLVSFIEPKTNPKPANL